MQTIVLILDRLKPETHEFTGYLAAQDFYTAQKNRAEVLAIYWLDASYNLHRYESI